MNESCRDKLQEEASEDAISPQNDKDKTQNPENEISGDESNFVDPLPATTTFIPSFEESIKKESLTLEAFQNNITEGKAFLEAELLEAAESSFTSALRLVYRRKNNKDQVKQCMYGLAKTYAAMSKAKNDLETLIHSVGLFNSALRRSNDKEEENEIIKELENLDGLALKIILGTDKMDFTKFSVDHKNKDDLNKLRSKYKEAMSDIVGLEDGIHPVEGEVGNDVGTEYKFVTAVEELFSVITDDMKDFLKTLFDQSTAKIGAPQCNYALIGLGSLARSEMTPYSDYEFTFLIDEDNEKNRCYFRCLTRYMHIRVLNLGETLVPSLGIKILNDTYSGNKGDDWFWEDAPNGISYDGAFAWASHTPLGRKPTKDKNWATELIGSPQAIANFQSSDSLMKEGYHTAEVLRKCTFVAGDASLMKTYEEKIGLHKYAQSYEEHEEDPCKIDLKDLYKETKKLLASGIRQHAPNFGTTNVGALWKVKKDIYRITGLFLSGAATLYDISSTSSWETIRKLVSKGVLNETAGHNMSVAHSISNWLRLKTYMHNMTQQENLTAQPPRQGENQQGSGKEGVERVFHIQKDDLIFRFMQTANLLEDIAMKLSLNEDMLIPLIPSSETLCDQTLFNKAMTCLRLMKYQEAADLLKECLKQKEAEQQQDKNQADKVPYYILIWRFAYVLSCLNQYDESQKYHLMALDECRKAFPEQPSHPDIIGALENLTLEYKNVGRFQDALKCTEETEKLIETWSEEEKAENFEYIKENTYNKSLVLVEMGDLQGAVKVLENVLEIIKPEQEKSSANMELAVLFGNLGSVHLQLGNFEKAEEYLTSCLNMNVELFGAGIAHPEISEILNNLGILYCMVQQIEAAVVVLEESVDMNSQLYGDDLTQGCAITSMYNLANAYFQLGLIPQALDSYKALLKHRRATRGKDAKHPSIAGNLNNIGACYSKLGYHTKAIFYYHLALEMREEIYGKNTPHFEIADSYFNLACVYFETDALEEAESYYKKALTMFKDVFGENSHHPYILEVHENLKRLYDLTGNEELASFHNEVLTSILKENPEQEEEDREKDEKGNDALDYDENEDEELQRAIAMSLGQL